MTDKVIIDENVVISLNGNTRKGMSTMASLYALEVGKRVLEEFKKGIGEEEYNKIINSPIKSCKCGFIKEGDDTMCPKCEKENSKQ